MAKFFFFEYIVGLFYRHVFTAPKESYGKPTQLGVTFASGYTHALTWRRFLRYDIVAGVVWATYAALLGYFGGKTFEENPLWGLLLAFVVASAIAVGVEVVRHYRRRRSTPSA